MLKSTGVTKLAFGSREFVGCHSRSAKALFVLGFSIASVGVLTRELLLLLLLGHFIGITVIARGGFSGIVRTDLVFGPFFRQGPNDFDAIPGIAMSIPRCLKRETNILRFNRRNSSIAHVLPIRVGVFLQSCLLGRRLLHSGRIAIRVTLLGLDFRHRINPDWFGFHFV
jgi:hypothetical protein